MEEIRFVLPPEKMNGGDLQNMKDLWIMAIYNGSYFFAKKQGVPRNHFNTSKNVSHAKKGSDILTENTGRREDRQHAAFWVPWTLFLPNTHAPQSFSVEILSRYKSRHDGEGANSSPYLELLKRTSLCSWLMCSLHLKQLPQDLDRKLVSTTRRSNLIKCSNIILSSVFPYPPTLARFACTAVPAICPNNIVIPSLPSHRAHSHISPCSAPKCVQIKGSHLFPPSRNCP